MKFVKTGKNFKNFTRGGGEFCWLARIYTPLISACLVHAGAEPAVVTLEGPVDPDTVLALEIFIKSERPENVTHLIVATPLND